MIRMQQLQDGNFMRCYPERQGCSLAMTYYSEDPCLEFRPKDKITRKEMCEMLVKYYEAKHGVIDGKVSLAFTDEINNPEVVSKAVAAGLMQGNADGTFGENKTATRAEAATVISNFLKGSN